jgi:1,3-beta-glucan synthase
VIRYAILYFVLLVVFIALIVGPVVAGKFMEVPKLTLPIDLIQPTGLNNNNTHASVTGSCHNNNTCPKFNDGNDQDTSEDASTTSDVSEKLRRFMAY